ncbi:MAG: DUF2357 domain-containing protein [Lachnospiraceae bacterium]|nr:DUF2357 domain-containing protein [Lachnospiraceae bacterium]
MLEKKERYLLTFRNASEASKRKADSVLNDISISFYATKVFGNLEQQCDESVYMSGYGLYSLLPGKEILGHGFMVYALKDDEFDFLPPEQLLNARQPIFSVSRCVDNKPIFSDCDNGFILTRFSDVITETTQDESYKVSVRFVLKMSGEFFCSAPVFVEFGSGSKDDEQYRMIQKVYEDQPLLLLSVFQNSPLNAFLDKDSKVRNTVDTKIRLLNKSCEVYESQQGSIYRKRKFRLSEENRVDRIEKLSAVTTNTLEFITRNPQYLIRVKNGKGITVKGKKYLPEKTLISRNVIDYDIYENRYIVSFLKMLLNECDRLKKQVKVFRDFISGYNVKIKNKKASLESELIRLDQQNNEICKCEKIIKQQYERYKIIFEFDREKLISKNIKKPRATAVFRQIREYNIFFKEVFQPWFMYGIKPADDIPKDVFCTAVSNPNTTYELYIVTEWINFLMSEGYQFDYNGAKYEGVKEKESRYSDYAYHFAFERGEGEEKEKITLFYSTNVYCPDNGQFDTQNVDEYLFRCTKNSMVSLEDGEENGKGAHYEPDFILKYEKGNIIRYIIADAKHKDFEEVRKKEMPKLIFKYLDSIKIFDRERESSESAKMNAMVSGLLAIYPYRSKDNSDTKEYREYIDYSLENEKYASFMCMNVTEPDESWKEDLRSKLEDMSRSETSSEKDLAHAIIQRVSSEGLDINRLIEELRIAIPNE